jgi:hypothetical protein
LNNRNTHNNNNRSSSSNIKVTTTKASPRTRTIKVVIIIEITTKEAFVATKIETTTTIEALITNYKLTFYSILQR